MPNGLLSLPPQGKHQRERAQCRGNRGGFGDGQHKHAAGRAVPFVGPFAFQKVSMPS